MTALTIDPRSYRELPMHHALADQVMEHHGLNPNDVFRVEISEQDAVVWSYPGYPRIPVYWDGEGWDLLAIRRRYPHPSRGGCCC